MVILTWIASHIVENIIVILTWIAGDTVEHIVVTNNSLGSGGGQYLHQGSSVSNSAYIIY